MGHQTANVTNLRADAVRLSKVSGTQAPSFCESNFDPAARISVSSPSVLAKKTCQCRADPSYPAAALSLQTLSQAEKKRWFTDCLICASAMSAMSGRRACNVYRSSQLGTDSTFLQAATCPAACVDLWRSPNYFGRLGGEQKCGSGETSIVAGSASFEETLIASFLSLLMHSNGQAVCSGAAAELLPRHAAQQPEDGGDGCLYTPRGLHGGTIPKFGCPQLCRVRKKATTRNRVKKAEVRPAQFTHHFEQ